MQHVHISFPSNQTIPLYLPVSCHSVTLGLSVSYITDDADSSWPKEASDIGDFGERMPEAIEYCKLSRLLPFKSSCQDTRLCVDCSRCWDPSSKSRRFLGDWRNLLLSSGKR